MSGPESTSLNVQETPQSQAMPVAGNDTASVSSLSYGSNPLKPSHYVMEQTQNPSANAMARQRLAPITSSQGQQPGLAETMAERQARIAQVLR